MTQEMLRSCAPCAIANDINVMPAKCLETLPGHRGAPFISPDDRDDRLIGFSSSDVKWFWNSNEIRDARPNR